LRRRIREPLPVIARSELIHAGISAQIWYFRILVNDLMVNMLLMKKVSGVSFSLLLALSSAAWSGALQAGLKVSFNESAPKDRFSLHNDSNCDFKNVSVEIDLSASAANLIFDTTSAGAGVEVFQPFEKVAGQFELQGTVTDGEQRLTLMINEFPAGETVSFTIDVDDTLERSELGNIRVSSSEMQGSQVNIQLDGNVATGTFGSNNTSIVEIESCVK
jgi:hypothetical protein